MEEKIKCCDKNGERRPSHYKPQCPKRQDSWMDFKGTIYRMASTVVLPKNKRICPRSLAAQSVRLKASSVKSLPHLQREEVNPKPKFYLRSVSVQDDTRTRIHNSNSSLPELKSKKVLFVPKAMRIDEVEEEEDAACETGPSSSSSSTEVITDKNIRYDNHDEKAASLRLKKSRMMLRFKSASKSSMALPNSPAITPVENGFATPIQVLKRDFPPNSNVLKTSEAMQTKSYYSADEYHQKSLSTEQLENGLEQEEESFMNSDYDKDDDDDISLALAYHDFYSCMPPPIFMLCITIAEVAFFAYHSNQLIDKYGRINKFSPAPLDSVLIYNPTRRYEVWRYLTYALVHSGYMHIINNIAIQLVLGILLEMVHKWWRVLAIYFAGILAGSLATSIAQPFNFLAGASAGVYALIAAHLSTVILNWTEMERPWIRVLIFLAFLLHDGGTAIYYGYVVGEKTNVGYAAHLGGAVAGLLVGIHVLKNLQWKEWEKVLWWFCIVVCALLLLFAVGWNIFRTDLFP